MIADLRQAVQCAGYRPARHGSAHDRARPTRLRPRWRGCRDRDGCGNDHQDSRLRRRLADRHCAGCAAAK